MVRSIFKRFEISFVANFISFFFSFSFFFVFDKRLIFSNVICQIRSSSKTKLIFSVAIHIAEAVPTH